MLKHKIGANRRQSFAWRSRLVRTLALILIFAPNLEVSLVLGPAVTKTHTHFTLPRSAPREALYGNIAWFPSACE